MIQVVFKLITFFQLLSIVKRRREYGNEVRAKRENNPIQTDNRPSGSSVLDNPPIKEE